jgi:hypothetical protein
MMHDVEHVENTLSHDVWVWCYTYIVRGQSDLVGVERQEEKCAKVLGACVTTYGKFQLSGTLEIK